MSFSLYFLLHNGDFICLIILAKDFVLLTLIASSKSVNTKFKVLKYGQLITIKIENMKLQHENTLIDNDDEIEKSSEEKEYGFIATSMGEGLAKIFKDFGYEIQNAKCVDMFPKTEHVECVVLLNRIEPKK